MLSKAFLISIKVATVVLDMSLLLNRSLARSNTASPVLRFCLKLYCNSPSSCFQDVNRGIYAQVSPVFSQQRTGYLLVLSWTLGLDLLSWG